MKSYPQSQIEEYVKKIGIEMIGKKLAYLSNWLVYKSWDKDCGKTVDEWQALVDKRWKQVEFLEACQKWWRENDGGQGKLC